MSVCADGVQDELTTHSDSARSCLGLASSHGLVKMDIFDVFVKWR